jgi:hypothetical protein
MPETQEEATLIEYGRLALKLATNAETRRPFLKAVRKVEPDRRFPDQDVEDLKEQLAADREKEKVEREALETTQRMNAARSGLIASGRYTEQEVGEIEKVMTKYGLADYEAGAKLYSADFRPANAGNTPPKQHGPWELPTYEGLMEDPIAAARKQAYAEIDRINGARR